MVMDRVLRFFLALSFVGCASHTDQPHPDAERWASMEHPPGSRHLQEHRVTNASYWRHGYVDASLTRWIGLGNTGVANEEHRHLHLKDFERDPNSEERHQRHQFVDCPFHVIDVHWRDSHELWVLGRRDDGVEVVERWEFRRQAGGWNAKRSSARTRIGHPLPVVQPPVVSIVGGELVPPRFRTEPLTYRRTLMYAAEPGVAIVDYDVDPDGRYLLVVDDDFGIRQVLANGHLATLRIPGSSTLPTGTTRIDSISIGCDANLGRVLIVRAGTLDFIGLYVDADNDGVFEGFEAMNKKSFDAFPFAWLAQGEY